MGRSSSTCPSCARARAAGDDVHRAADHAGHAGFAVRRGEPARGVAHCHSPRLHLVHGLRRREVSGAQKGVLIAGALGGLVSSTAVTIDSARRAAAHEGPPTCWRRAWRWHPPSVPAGGRPGGGAEPGLLLRRAGAGCSRHRVGCLRSVPELLAAGGRWGRQRAKSGELPQCVQPVGGPRLRRLAGCRDGAEPRVGESLGPTWVVLGAIVAGLADVDAITISLTRLTPGPLTPDHAALAILAAVASDTVSKVGIGAVIGRGRSRCRSRGGGGQPARGVRGVAADARAVAHAARA